MKTKMILKVMMLSLIGVMAVSCAPKKDQKNKISSRTVRGVDTPAVNQTPTTSTQAPSASGKQWGEVTRGSYTQANFQYHVQALVSNLAEEDGSQVALGTVSGDANQSTGVRFWGSVQLSTGALNRNGGASNAQVTASGAALRISIIDSYVGQTNSAGENITEIPIYIASGVDGFVSATGTVNGNQADITFKDKFGSIRLQGSFDANWFYGQVVYDNDFFWNKQAPGAAGYLGVFKVPTCGFFACQ